MNIELPIRVIWKGKASSSYDLDTINRRLAVIALRDDDEARQEQEFLARLKQELEVT